MLARPGLGAPLLGSRRWRLREPADRTVGARSPAAQRLTQETTNGPCLLPDEGAARRSTRVRFILPATPDRSQQQEKGQPLVVDGNRQAVEAVGALPRAWVSPEERLVLLVLACDSYDGVDSAPGWDNLSAWTGMHASSVRAIVARLEEPTAKRPALLRREGELGRRRRQIVLLFAEPAGGPAGPPAGEPASEPADGTGTSLALPLSLVPKQTARRSRRTRAVQGRRLMSASAWGPSSDHLEWLA